MHERLRAYAGQLPSNASDPQRLSAVRGETETERNVPQRSPDAVGGYRLLGCLADGVTGTSYLAASDRAEFGEHLVIVNKIRSANHRLGKLGQALRSEALLATRIEHPNAVRTLGVIQQKDGCYWVTEYLDGQPFSKLVRGSRIAPYVSLRTRLQVLRDTLAGLHAAHQLRDAHGRCLNVVHAGMRPSNVIVTYDGQVKVVGFGVAHALLANSDWQDLPGRLRYLAPEQLLDEEPDRRADVFALGVMLWESISLRKFASNTVQERATIERRLTGAEPRIVQVSPQVPPLLAHICDKALRVDRKQRFQTAREFQEALDEYMSSSGAVASPRTVGQLVAKKFERERTDVERVIARETRFRDEPHTAVEARRPRRHLPEDDDGEATVVLDSSLLIEQSRITLGQAPSAPGPAATTRFASRAPHGLRSALTALIVVLALAFWIGYLLAGN